MNPSKSLSVPARPWSRTFVNDLAFAGLILIGLAVVALYSLGEFVHLMNVWFG